VGYFAREAYPVYEPGTIIGPGHQGTLGYGFPTGLGVAAGNPGRPVVAISGDGGFGWCLQELSTARKYNLGLVTVVFADGHFGNVRGMLNQQFGQAYETELANPDFMTLAKAFGVPATRVTSPEGLEGALKSAIAAGGPHLIEVPVGQMPSPWSLLRLRNQGAGARVTSASTAVQPCGPTSSGLTSTEAICSPQARTRSRRATSAFTISEQRACA
jgi:acetolactate synthase-1/2/3 large subunit